MTVAELKAALEGVPDHLLVDVFLPPFALRQISERDLRYCWVASAEHRPPSSISTETFEIYAGQAFDW